MARIPVGKDGLYALVDECDRHLAEITWWLKKTARAVECVSVERKEAT